MMLIVEDFNKLKISRKRNLQIFNFLYLILPIDAAILEKSFNMTIIGTQLGQQTVFAAAMQPFVVQYAELRTRHILCTP